MSEREEFEYWWKVDRNYQRSDFELAWVAFQAGRRSRQKQDAELCLRVFDATSSPACHGAMKCNVKIVETP